MGELISNNILLPLMYLLVNIILVIGVILLFMMLIEKLMDSDLIRTIMRKIK